MPGQNHKDVGCAEVVAQILRARSVPIPNRDCIADLQSADAGSDLRPEAHREVRGLQIIANPRYGRVQLWATLVAAMPRWVLRGSEIGEPRFQFFQRLSSMTELVLNGFRQFSKRLVASIRDKKRIITEPATATRFKHNMTFANPIE